MTEIIHGDDDFFFKNVLHLISLLSSPSYIYSAASKTPTGLILFFRMALILIGCALLGPTKLTDKEDFGGTALQEAIDVAYKETSKYLLELLISKYKFVDHLKVRTIDLPK